MGPSWTRGLLWRNAAVLAGSRRKMVRGQMHLSRRGPSCGDDRWGDRHWFDLPEHNDIIICDVA